MLEYVKNVDKINLVFRMLYDSGPSSSISSKNSEWIFVVKSCSACYLHSIFLEQE